MLEKMFVHGAGAANFCFKAVGFGDGGGNVGIFLVDVSFALAGAVQLVRDVVAANDQFGNHVFVKGGF